MGAGNQASDGKGQGPGYQIGELDIGPKAKPGPSGEQPVTGASEPRTSGTQAAGVAQAQQPLTAQQARVPAGAATVQGHGMAHAAEIAQQQAAQIQQQAALRAQQLAQAAQQQGLTPQQQAALAQQQAALRAQQQAALAAQQHAALAAQQAVRQGSQTGLAPAQAAPSSQAGLQPVMQAAAAIPAAQPANQQTTAKAEKGLGRANAFEDDSQSGGGLELEIDISAVRKPAAKPAAPAAGNGKPGAAQAKGAPAAGKPGAAPAGKAVGKAAPSMPAFGGDKEIGDGFGEPEDGPALELEHVDRKNGDRVVAKGPDLKAEAIKEEQAVRELADFGVDPETITECVKYAWHVIRRLMVLRRERDKAAQDAGGLEADYHTALVEMGQALMGMAQDTKTAPLRSRIAAVIDANAKVNSADQSMSKTKEANLQAVKELERQAEEMQTSLKPFHEAEAAAVAVHKKADEELRRGQGLQKRIEIELRAVMDAKDQPGRVEELKFQLEQRKAMVAELQHQLEQAAQALGAARRDLAMRRGTLDALEEKKDALLEDAKKREAEVEQKAKEAEGTHSTALRSLALYCIEQKLQDLVEDRYQWVQEVGGAYEEARKVVVRYDRALVIYDKNSLIKGVAVAGGLALFLIAGLVFAMMGTGGGG